MMEPVFIRGTTRLIGILGNPVGHSLSPLIHNHAFSRLGLPYAYIPLPVAAEHLQTVISAMRACAFAGANVTVPHKTAVVPFCDELSDFSVLTGTVNTLYFKDGQLCGTSTDAEGFFQALSSASIAVEGSTIVILGNGGTARTLGFALAAISPPTRLALVGRKKERVQPLAEEIAAKTRHPVQWMLFDDASLQRLLADCSLLINCTPVGMHPDINRSPLPARMLHREMTVFDTIYNPAKTLLLRQAEAAGCAVHNGLRMLLYQGLASFTYWTGVEADEKIFDLGELQRLVEE